MMGESIVRASTMGAVEGADERTVTANLCPSTGADDAPVPAPSEAIAALAANTPCKWRPVPIKALAAIPGVGRQTLVRIGATLYELRQAPWAIRPDDRGARRQHTLQVAADPRRGPRADGGRGTPDTGADRRNALRAAPSAMGHSARHSLTG